MPDQEEEPDASVEPEEDATEVGEEPEDEGADEPDDIVDAATADDPGAEGDADGPASDEADPEPDESEEPETDPDAGDEPEPEGEPDSGDEPEPEDLPAAVSRTEAARRRVSRAFTRPRRTQVMVAVLLGVLGFAAVTQVRVNDPEGNYSALRQQELIDVLDGLAGARQRAQAEIEQLEEAHDDLLDESSQRRAALEQAQGDVENLNILAGLVPVTGPGIRVTVTEETGAVQLDSMLDVIQELRTADAEAIQLNGEVRVVADTSFEQATGGFLVDGQLLEAPYLIEAIGEPAALAGAMDTQVGAGAGLRNDGADVQIEELNSLDITAVHEPEDPQYAVPEEDQ